MMSERTRPLFLVLIAPTLAISLISSGCRTATESAPPAGLEANEGRAWEWEGVDGEWLALSGPRGVLWRFNYGPRLDLPYFHPLNAADGRTLTADSPPDHAWHHGLWFCWKFINGVNYWEIDAAIGSPAGRTSWRDVRILTADDGSARITMVLAYRPAAEGENATVLRERRQIAVAPPDTEDVVAIDWCGQFMAVRDVVLDRTPLPGEPGGQVWGGYSGLSLRLADGLADRAIMTSEGPVSRMPDDRYRGRHAAMDYSGLLDGEPAGAAIIDHPANPRSPTPWYAVRSEIMSFFTPAVLCHGPMTLKPGDSFTLRYRILVHTGRWDAGRLRKERERFALTSTVDEKTRPRLR